jgi:hypothetical protein
LFSPISAGARARCGRAFLARKSDLIEGADDVIISARADLSARAIVANIGSARFAYKISNILAYFPRRAFVNGLAYGLP